MALFKFTKNIVEEKQIDVFNYGKHTRDFTYIDDIVGGIIKYLMLHRQKILIGIVISQILQLAKHPGRFTI